MTTTADLTTTLGQALGLPRRLAEETARHLREGGMLPDGEGQASVEHGVTLLLGLMAAPALGVNVYPTDPVTSRDRNIRRKVWEIRDTERAMKGALRNQALSDRARAQLQQEYAATIQNLAADLERYQGESRVHPRLR